MTAIFNALNNLVNGNSEYARKCEEAALLRRLERAMKHYGVRSAEVMALEAELANLEA